MKKRKGNQLREYMLKNGMSQVALAQMFKISEQYISHYFAGRRTFGARIALRISKLTGIPMEELYK